MLNTDVAAGKYRAAGLPNLTGICYPALDDHSSLPVLDSEGVFYSRSLGVSVEYVRGAGSLTNTSYGVRFDASRANPIYGKSATVQPSALNVKMLIKY